MALHNATIVDGVPYIAIDQLILRSASENLSPAIQKPPRFVVINERGKFSALDRDVMGFTSDGACLLVVFYIIHHCSSLLFVLLRYAHYSNQPARTIFCERLITSHAALLRCTFSLSTECWWPQCSPPYIPSQWKW